MGKKKDCGCGKGSKNCISKQSLVKWVEKEMKKLDCGCGCKGKKGFCEKYGITPYKRKLVGGKILADCPPGWRNDGLTCVEPCKNDEYDDGLTCRKKCEPGWINDGLTCRKPITSSMNSCPDGSKDIAGTCWGPVRKDCIDDCFKHPAPGCRTYQCGRLRGAFGEDWGPKWCTDCNLRCGQTCWDVQGITKQLHQRELRLMGGEVIGQIIRGKQIRGRVNFDALGKEIAGGLGELFSDNGPLAKAFDPEKNGVGDAFRKFGNDIENVAKEVAAHIKQGFDKMGEETKRAFEQFAKDAESKFKQFGEDFVHKMKDPDFWVEAVGIMAQIGAAALSIAVTVGTLGAGAPLTVGLMAAAAMAGPAAKMIADAARGRPIDALDIAQLVIAGATAVVPGMSETVGPMVKVGLQAASLTIEAVRVGQGLGLIPETCIANCPVFESLGGEMPVDPPFPPPPPPAGQLTDDEITKLAPPPGDPDLFKRKIRGPDGVKIDNPDYIDEKVFIANYRREHYGSDSTPGGLPTSEEDKIIDEAINVPLPTEEKDISDLVGESEFPPFDSPGEFPPFETTPGPAPDFPSFEPGPSTDFPSFEPGPSPDFPSFESGPSPDFPSFEPGPSPDFPSFESGPVGDFPSFEPGPSFGAGFKMQGGTNPEDLPLIEPMKEGDVTINPWGTMRSGLPTRNIPLTHLGNPFSPECYARNNPEIAKESGNDPAKLTAHWIDIGSKQGLDGDCANSNSTAEERLKQMKENENIAGRKANCKATNRFWIESENKCDGHRNADGSANTAAEECKEKNSYFNTSGQTSFCNEDFLPDGKPKSIKERCNTRNSYYDPAIPEHLSNIQNGCYSAKNVDGTIKTNEEVCNTLDSYWNMETKNCEFNKNLDGIVKDEKKMCAEANGFWDTSKEYGDVHNRSHCDISRNRGGEKKTSEEICIENGGVMNGNRCNRINGVATSLPFNHKSAELKFKYYSGSQQKAFIDDLRSELTKNLDVKCFMENNTNEQISQLENIKNMFGDPRTRQGKEYVYNYTPQQLASNPNLEKKQGKTFVEVMREELTPLRVPEVLIKFYKDLLISAILTNAESKNQVPIDWKCKPTGTGKSQKSLTLYYADWCPHCHDMMPEWNKLGKLHKGIKIEKFEQKQTKVKVDGFPTIVFRDGKKVETYNGERSKKAIVNYLKNKL